MKDTKKILCRVDSFKPTNVAIEFELPECSRYGYASEKLIEDLIENDLMYKGASFCLLPDGSVERPVRTYADPELHELYRQVTLHRNLDPQVQELELKRLDLEQKMMDLKAEWEELTDLIGVARNVKMFEERQDM